ncbi:MAG: hypothetical protein K2X01_11495 [Cyanobacteria bacterium]|nr:hypothetical protein [Cyanobacteriota bacterium]
MMSQTLTSQYDFIPATANDSSNISFVVVPRDDTKVLTLGRLFLSSGTTQVLKVRLGGRVIWANHAEANNLIPIDFLPFQMQGRKLTKLAGTVSQVDDSKTFTADATTDIITCNAHGLVSAQPVVFKNSGGGLPGGLTAGTTYYAGNITANTFKVYTNSSLTTLVDITSAGTGTHNLDGTYIHGVNTNFTTDFAAGDTIVIDGGNAVTVSSVNSNTVLIAAFGTTATLSGKNHARGADNINILKGTAATNVYASVFYGQSPA